MPWVSRVGSTFPHITGRAKAFPHITGRAKATLFRSDWYTIPRSDPTREYPRIYQQNDIPREQLDDSRISHTKKPGTTVEPIPHTQAPHSDTFQ